MPPDVVNAPVHAGAGGGGGGGVTGPGVGLGSVGDGESVGVSTGTTVPVWPWPCVWSAGLWCGLWWGLTTGFDRTGGATTITGGATAAGAGDAVTGVGFDGFCVCWMATAPTLTVPATMTVMAAAVTLSAMLTAPWVTAGAAVTWTAACCAVAVALTTTSCAGCHSLRRNPGSRNGARRMIGASAGDAAALAAAVPGAAEALLGAVDQRLGLLRRYAEGLADLLVRASLELAQDQRLAVMIGDLRQDRADLLLIEDALDRLGRVVGQRGGEPGVLGDVGRHGVALRTARARADHVERHVGGDARDPRLELIPAVERAQTAIDPQHRLLDGLVGLLAILQDAVADLGRQGPVLHEDVGVGVDVTRLEREHQALVVVQVETRPGEVSDIGEACGQGPPFSVWLDRGNVGDRPGVVPPQQHRHQPIDDLTPRD